MNEEIEELIKKECNDVKYCEKKEEQLEKRKNDALGRLLHIIKKHYKDELPINGRCSCITLGKYDVFVCEQRGIHFIEHVYWASEEE